MESLEFLLGCGGVHHCWTYLGGQKESRKRGATKSLLLGMEIPSGSTGICPCMVAALLCEEPYFHPRTEVDLSEAETFIFSPTRRDATCEAQVQD